MEEKILTKKKNGMAVLAITSLLYLCSIGILIFGGFLLDSPNNNDWVLGTVLFVVGMVYLCIGWIPYLGLKVLKFFPAEQSGGLAKIKAMAAPFPMFKIMPTGGISLKNLVDYISCPTICACGGSYMVTADLIDNGKWDEITDLCKQSIDIVKANRK